MSTLGRKTAIDSAAQVGVMAFSLVAGIVLARSLGDEGRGSYIFATSFAGNLAFSLLNLGMESAASVLVAKDPRRLPQIHAIVLGACLAIGVTTVLAGVVFAGAIREHLLPGITGTALLLLLGALPFWIYQYAVYGMLTGLGRVASRAGFDLAFNFAQNVAVVAILLGMRSADSPSVVTMLIASYYGVTICSSLLLPLLFLRSGPLLARPDRALVREFFHFGFWIFVGNMGANFGQRIDQYFVRRASVDAAAFGVYTLATSLTERTRVLPQALVRSASPRVATAGAAEAARLVAACFRQMLAVGLILCAAGILVSPLIPIVYTKAFAPAVLPFIIFLCGKTIHNAAWMLTPYFSTHLARPWIATTVNWCTLPFMAVASWLAMKSGGLVAVSLVAAFSYVLVSGIFIVLFLRYQDTVGLRDLFLIRGEDLARWRGLLRRKTP